MTLTLRLLPEILAVCQFPVESPIPEWAISGNFYSITRTFEELSLVLRESEVPEGASGVKVEGGWRVIMVAGPLDFSLTGILAAITTPMATSGIPIFALSTFNTDYILVKQERISEALVVLRNAGHNI